MKSFKEVIIRLSIFTFGLTFGVIFTAGIFATVITINLPVETMNQLFIGARVLLIVSILAQASDKVLTNLDEWKKRDKATTAKLLFLILVPSLIVYEIGNTFLFGLFGKAVFPSLFLSLL